MQTCKNCGNQISDNIPACPWCGAQTQPPGLPYGQTPGMQPPYGTPAAFGAPAPGGPNQGYQAAPAQTPGGQNQGYTPAPGQAFGAPPANTAPAYGMGQTQPGQNQGFGTPPAPGGTSLSSYGTPAQPQSYQATPAQPPSFPPENKAAAYGHGQTQPGQNQGFGTPPAPGGSQGFGSPPASGGQNQGYQQPAPAQNNNQPSGAPPAYNAPIPSGQAPKYPSAPGQGFQAQQTPGPGFGPPTAFGAPAPNGMSAASGTPGFGTPAASGMPSPYGSPAPAAPGKKNKPAGGGKKAKTRLIIIIVAAVLVVAGLVVGGIFLFGGGGGSIKGGLTLESYRVAPSDIAALSAEDALTVLGEAQLLSQPAYTRGSYSGEDSSFILPDGSYIKPGGEILQHASTADGEALCYTITDPDNDDYNIQLKYVEDGNSTTVAGDVSSSFYLALLTGNLYYFDVSGDEPALYLYSEGSNILLAEGVHGFAVSPNEEYILYVTRNGMYRCATGGTPEQIIEEDYRFDSARPVFISNDGETILYLGAFDYGDLTIYCITPSGEYDVTVEASVYDLQFYVLYSGSEAMFTCDEGLFHITENGIEQLTYEKTYLFNYYLANSSEQDYSNEIRTHIWLAESFDNYVYFQRDPDLSDYDYHNIGSLYLQSGDTAKLINENVRCDNIPDTIFQSANGAHLVYCTDDGGLYLAGIDGDSFKQSELASGVTYLRASADLVHIYYIATDYDQGIFSELYHVQGGGRAINAAQTAYSIEISPDGLTCLYTTYDDDLNTMLGAYNNGQTILLPVSTTSYLSISHVFNGGSFIYRNSGAEAYYLYNGEESVPLE